MVLPALERVAKLSAKLLRSSLLLFLNVGVLQAEAEVVEVVVPPQEVFWPNAFTKCVQKVSLVPVPRLRKERMKMTALLQRLADRLSHPCLKMVLLQVAVLPALLMHSHPIWMTSRVTKDTVLMALH